MRKAISFLLVSFFLSCIAACSDPEGKVVWGNQSLNTISQGMETQLALSDRFIEISDGNHQSTFQLYSTEGAENLYEQLPLELELSNFQDVQWMFHLPEKLNVTDREIYRDGKKGELSYYEPWGDVFILYQDFYSSDEIYRLGTCSSGIDEIGQMSGVVTIKIATKTGLAESEISDLEADNDAEAQTSTQENQMEEEMIVEENTFYITAGDTTFTADFEKNSSAEAMKKLLEQGPLTVSMSDYGNFEKVGNLGAALPRNDQSITTKPGDVILYQGNSITIYYDQNSWNFTRLGKIRNVTKEKLLKVLGRGDVSVTFSLKDLQIQSK